MVVEGELHALEEMAGIVVIDMIGEVALEEDVGGVEGGLHAWD